VVPCLPGKRGENRIAHGQGIAHHIRCCEPHDRESASTQIVVTYRVIALSQLVAVRDTVNFDNQPRLKAGKVYNVGTKPDLLAKMIAIHAQTIDQSPEANFRGGRGSA
jgi:hypothetical protein